MICRLCEVRQQTTTNDTVYCRVRLVAGTFVSATAFTVLYYGFTSSSKCHLCAEGLLRTRSGHNSQVTAAGSRARAPLERYRASRSTRLKSVVLVA